MLLPNWNMQPVYILVIKLFTSKRISLEEEGRMFLRDSIVHSIAGDRKFRELV